MQIVTWNVNSLKVRSDHLEDLFVGHSPDIVCLQETKVEDSKFPREVFDKYGYSVYYHGQKTYNGVAIASKHRLVNIESGIRDFQDDQARVLSGTTQDGVRVVDVYVPNGSTTESDKFQYKLRWINALINHLRDELNRYKSLILLGDFNIAPTDRDVYDPEKFKDQVLCTSLERGLYQKILDLGLTDSFDQIHGGDGSDRFTWWDYRMNAFRRRQGLRIDHILISSGLMNTDVSVEILKSYRALERPSDHAPVVARLGKP